MSSFRKELNKLQNVNNLYHKFKYFCWKNGLNTTKTKYAEMDYEEFRKNAKITDQQYANLEYWEEKAEYKRLLFLLAEDRLDVDLLDVYESVKEKVKNDGGNANVTAFLNLQKQIRKKNVGAIDEEIEEDDGLEI